MMQQESRFPFPIQPNSQQQIPSTNSLYNLIKQTYSPSSTTQHIKSAQLEIQNLLQNSTKTLDQLYTYINIKPPYNIQIDNNFKRACANIIKKYYYQIAQNNQNKNKYIENVYEILTTCGGIDMVVKEIVGVGLEYIFNRDQKSEYKQKWCQHVKGQLFALVQNSQAWTLQTLQVIYGIVIFFIAFFNSLIQPQDQVNFINQILKPLCKAASLCCQFTKDNINQSINPHSLFSAANKIFQLLSISTQRLLQQQQIIHNQCQQFITSQHLTNIIIQYLYLFSQHQSIISKYPSLNQIKSQIVQMLYIMINNDYQINISVLALIYGTFVQGSLRKQQDDDQDDYIQKILVKCIAILEIMLDRKICYQFFINNKIQIIFALLMYSKSSNKQLSDLYEDQQKFAQLAQQYSQCYSTSSIIKVRAANLIKTYISRIDEGLNNLTELCVIFITGSLATSVTDSQILKLAKQTYANFPFINLNPRQKLDISFMVLTILSPFLQKRLQIKAVIISILMTNFNTIFQINDQLIIVRLIRLIGYYPNSLYFKLILGLMGNSRLFLIQGITCFDRISRNKVYLEMFPMMHMVFAGLIDFMEVDDPIFDRLIVQNYESIMKKNQQLYKQVLDKIYMTFSQKIKNLNIQGAKQNAIICLNYLQKMLKMQKTDKKLKLLEIAFERMQNQSINIPILQDNFISIYEVITSKSIILSQKIQIFVKNFSIPQKLSHYSSYSQYFKLLNKFILKTQNSATLTYILTNMMQYLGKTEQQKFNYGIVPQLAHSIGHIVVYQMNLQLNLNFVQFIVRMAIKKQQIRGHLTLNQPWYLFLILHFMYVKPAHIREYLIEHKLYYPLMIALFNTKFTCKIQRKAAVITIQQLLNYQTDQNSIKQLIKYCVKTLLGQKQKYQVKRILKNKQKRSRKQQLSYQNQNQNQMKQMQIQQQGFIERERQRQEEQRMQNQTQKTKDQDNILFKDMKHPFDKICEFSMFKQKVIGMVNVLKLNTAEMPKLTQILNYEWHKNTIRRVVRISKQ